MAHSRKRAARLVGVQAYKTPHAAPRHPRNGAGSDQEVGITSVSTLVPALFSALTAIDLDWEGGD